MEKQKPLKKFALIVGGGKGLRFGGDIPKQFQILQGKPVLFHSVELFAREADEVILVLPSSHFDFFHELVSKYDLNTDSAPFALVSGGDTRTQSVLNGLKALKGPGVVAIHDAVRPLVTTKLISELFQAAIESGGAIPVLPVRDSLRKKEQNHSVAVNREDFVAVQTPQCFHLELLKSAYERFGKLSFTDDASLFEMAGGHIRLMDGEQSNIKITYPEDLVFAESILTVREKN